MNNSNPIPKSRIKTESNETSAAPDGAARDRDSGERSFSRGLGFLLQAVGAVMLIVSSCGCCTLAYFEGGVWHTQGSPATLSVSPEARENRARTGYGTLLLTTVIGSFCLVGVGLGLQADRGRFPAAGAALVTPAMTLLYGWSGYLIWSSPGSVSLAAVGLAGLLGVGSLLLTVMAWTAMAEVFRTPPAGVGPPTVPADAFPDPWAQPRAHSTTDSPTVEAIRKRRQQLHQQLSDLDEAERRLGATRAEQSD